MNVKESGALRSAELHTLGEIFGAYGGREIAASIIGGGGGPLEFARRVGERTQTVGLDQALGLEFDPIALKGYSLIGMIRSHLLAGHPHDVSLERAISDDIARRMPIGLANGNFCVPWSMLLRDFNLASTGAQMAAPVAMDYAQSALRAQLGLGKLGCIIAGGFKGDFSIPRMNAGVSASFLTEVGTASESNPTTEKASFTARRVSTYVDTSKTALLLSSAEQFLVRDLVAGAFAALEYGAVNGAGTGVEMHGLRNTSGIGTVVGGANGAQLAFSHLADLEAAPGTANAHEAAAGYLVNSKSRRWLRTQPKGTGLPYTWDGGERPLLGHRAAVTNNVPGNLTKGTSTTVCSSVIYSSDWATSLLAIYGAPSITVDPVTLAATGQVRITLDVFADFGCLQPGAYAKMDDALTN